MNLESYDFSHESVQFLGIWETLNNPKFNRVEFDPLLEESGKNSFTMSPSRWISEFNAIGIKTKATKNGGTFAHRDIALEFASWISLKIKLYIIKEFQRLKVQESEQLEWKGKRLLTKLNYLIHTDALKEHLVPIEQTGHSIPTIIQKYGKRHLTLKTITSM